MADAPVPVNGNPNVATAQAHPNNQQSSTESKRVVLDPKNAGIWGLTTIVLGNIATLAGKIEKVNEQVQKIQEQLHLGSTQYLLYIVLAVISVGYLLVSTPLYKHLKSKLGSQSQTQRILIPVVVVILVGGLYALNVWALPLTVDVTTLKSRKGLWIEKIRGTQQNDGGFSTMLFPGGENPVQPFTTAQGLTAIISATHWDDAKISDPQVIRSAFEYIDSQRSSFDGGWTYFGKTASDVAGRLGQPNHVALYTWGERMVTFGSASIRQHDIVAVFHSPKTATGLGKHPLQDSHLFNNNGSLGAY